MPLTKDQKAALVAKFGANDKDTGNSKVQIAILSQRIAALTEHLKTHHGDGQTKRGLSILIGKRRSLLDYLSRTDYDAYKSITKELNIRK